MSPSVRYSLMNSPLFAAIAALLLATNAVGQNQTLNLPRYDSKPVHFGFILGINQMDFRVRTATQLPESVFNVKSTQQPGFMVGIVSNFRLNKYMDLRHIPTYSAGERLLQFDALDPTTGQRRWIDKKIESSLVILPLELKLKTDRIGNHRWYAIASVNYTLDLASKAKVVDDRLFKLQQQDFGYDLGVGLDLYFEYFKFSPQLRYQFGQGDLRVQDGTNYVASLNGLQSRCTYIVFTFE